jgi:hypothetical protein
VTDPRALLDELVRADEAHSRALRELDGLADETAALRRRAEELAALLASAPAERERLATELAEAEAVAAERRVALAEAEVELDEAGRSADEERRAAARRFHVRAKDALFMAEKGVGTASAARDGFEARVAAAKEETQGLEARAGAIAEALRGRPRLAAEAGIPPRPGLAGISEWASVARAALLVARGGIAAERDGVIRQVSELGSAILGEPVAATSAALIARQVEAALGGR